MHSLYDGDNQDRPLFAHYVPTRPEDRAYYRRAIARFRLACQAGATLLVLEETGEIELEFARLCAVVDKQYPLCRIRAVRHVYGNLAIEGTAAIGSHELLRLRASTVTGGVRLQRPEDEATLMETILQATE